MKRLLNQAMCWNYLMGIVPQVPGVLLERFDNSQCIRVIVGDYVFSFDPFNDDPEEIYGKLTALTCY